MPSLSSLLAPLTPPLCWSCGARAEPGLPLCPSCRAALRRLPRETVLLDGIEVWAPLAYEGPARAVVGALKFRGAIGLARQMAAQIVAGAPESLLAPPAVLVPVPLHPRRRRGRGYNQAEGIAAAVGRRTGMRVEDCLRRGGPSGQRQVGRDRAERRAGVAGAIGVVPGGPPPERVVLVDDVVTTGATLAACVDALYRAGCSDVAAIAYARTPGR